MSQPAGAPRLSTDDVTYINTPTSLESQNRSQQREAAHRLEDDLELLRIERVASRVSGSQQTYRDDGSHLHRAKTRRGDHQLIDEFAKEPIVPPKVGSEPHSKVARFFRKVHSSSVLVRYFTYIVPLALVLLIPLMLGAMVFKNASVGGVGLMWFMIWLEVVWLSLWAGRIAAKVIPYPVRVACSAFTNGSRKWQDMAHQLEVPVTLFFWWLAIYTAFLPVMTRNHVDGSRETQYWERNANIVLLVLFIAAILNLVEKILIQLIAIGFHTRTYADRIELNNFQIASLVKLYKYVKEHENDVGRNVIEEGEEGTGLPSGAVTPKVVLGQAKKGAQLAFNKVGDVVGKIAGDFTGREVAASSSPQQVVLTLLQTTEGSNILARRLYRGFRKGGHDNIQEEDLAVVFESEEEAEAAFSMFDNDLNGDLSCEEMELACVEIGRERKAVIKSLKVLDNVIGKLDECMTFVVAVITILVFLSLISKSTAGVLTSASSSVLALSWLFSATAQEFLASIIFVFVKHPFDVGDRVDIYNTGVGTKDTFMVKEIALMYTEFRKLEGAVVQAPNSLLNTLFVLNMRRTGSLAEAVPIAIKFGTTIDQIDDLRQRMLDFVKSEKREYQGKILTELRDIPDMHSVEINVVFFYKSNWQNELVRLSRRNKFMCALMCNVVELGIESPNMRWPGQKPGAPVYVSSNMFGDSSPTTADVAPTLPTVRSARNADSSLGARDLASEDDTGDVFNDEPRRGVLPKVVEEEEEGGDGVSRSTSRGSAHTGFLHRRRSRAGSTGGAHHEVFGRRSQDEEMGIQRSRSMAGEHESVEMRRF